MDPDLWDDSYLSIEDGRWLACAMGTIAFYEATWQAFCAVYAQGDTHTAAAHDGRLTGLIRRPEEAAAHG